MRVIMNSNFFDTINPFQYMWPTMVHMGLETVGSWAVPAGYNYRSLRMEYHLCETTAVETFRITDLTGRHVYVQDSRELPCAKSGSESINNIMELLHTTWKIGGSKEDYDTGRTHTALTQCHGWFMSWMQKWLMTQVKKVGETTAPTSHKLCQVILEEVH